MPRYWVKGIATFTKSEGGSFDEFIEADSAEQAEEKVWDVLHRQNPSWDIEIEEAVAEEVPEEAR